MTRRGLALIGAGLAILAAGAYTGYWFWGARAVETALADWTAEQRRAGVAIAHGPAALAGFPGAVRLTLPAFRAAGPADGPWVAAPALTVTVAPWRPLDYALALDGPVEGGAADALAWTAENAAGAARLGTDGRVERAELTLRRVGLALAGMPGEAEAARAHLEATAPPGGALGMTGSALTLRLDALGLPDWADNPLGRAVQAAALRAVAVGPLPGGVDAAGLSAWRDAGGAVDVPWLRLDWGAVRLEGTGRVGLDGLLRPHGAIALSIAGFREALDGAVAAGLLERGAAQGIGLALGLMARQDARGRAVVDAPLRLDEGRLSLGPFAIARVGPVAGASGSTDPAAGVSPAGASSAASAGPRAAPLPPPLPPPLRLRPERPPTLAPDWSAPSD